MPIKVFWLEPTDEHRLWLRRYRSGSTCALPDGYHDARVLIGDSPSVELIQPPDDDARWPTHCACGYAFQPDDERQRFSGQLHRGAPDGQLYTLQDAPPGAMWDAAWRRLGGGSDPWTGPDGISLVVKLPNGSDWMVDSEASNCTRSQWGPTPEYPTGKVWRGRTHYCWIRHGDPRTGELHVDKNGETCAAGAGSILSGSYHGFLHNSHLSPC